MGPMKILIADISALSLWDRGIANRARPVDAVSLEDFRVELRALNELDPERFGLRRPAHVMIPAGQPRPRSSHWQGHFWNKPIPPGSVCQIDSGVFIATPEFVFACMLYRLGFLDLVKLGMELTGSYSTLVAPGDGFIVRPPLTTVRGLSDYLRKVNTKASAGVAAHTIGMMADNVESPMECAARMMLCLPYRYGCPGFAKPEMNHAIQLDSKERQLLGKGHLRCDAFWERENVALEYKGGIHGTEVKLRSDTARENILLSRGITVVPATYASLATDEGFACLCEALSGALGKRLRFPKDHLSRLHRTRGVVLRGNTCSWIH